MTWDILPAASATTQNWGCVDYNGEWAAWWCPGGYYHAGIDLGLSDADLAAGKILCGQPIHATRPGVIDQIGVTYLGDSAVVIHADEGVYIEHGHMDSAIVQVGQRVSPGDILGFVGTKGSSTACHLHVEVRVDGPNQGVDNQAAAIRDPRPYLMSEVDMTPEEHQLLVDVKNASAYIPILVNLICNGSDNTAPGFTSELHRSLQSQNPSGGLTHDQVVQAVKDALKAGTG